MQQTVGMYGGKFMPFHKGHLACLEQAVRECDIVYLVLVTGGLQEQHIFANLTNEEDKSILSPRARFSKIQQIAQEIGKKYNKIVIPCHADVTTCIDNNGNEDWDKETPIIQAATGCKTFDRVYGSEPEYEKYFIRAYRGCLYRCIDPERKNVPISGTAIRAMNKEDRKKWTV